MQIRLDSAHPSLPRHRPVDLDRFRRIRGASVALTATLGPEDMQAQSMDDASPTKWHLAHTTWFFETFVLEGEPGHEPFHPAFRVLFNSYYEQIGEQHPRRRRGMLTRPSLEDVLAYRESVDERIARLLEKGTDRLGSRAVHLELGLQHEQQHQELMLMDAKHVLAQTPLEPSFRIEPPAPLGSSPPQSWFRVHGGTHEIGHSGRGFAFDNEGPRHRVHLEPFALASRPINNRELLEFVECGGYETPTLWLSDAWGRIQNEERWRAPMYWKKRDDQWFQFTMHGLEPLRLDDPATHLSYYEADAFATWSGARLPREAEWEVTAAPRPIEGNFVEEGQWHPRPVPADPSKEPVQLFGDVWEWTQSAYSAYPGFRTPPGPVGEYNGKFMANQFVLRGGCWATPRSHFRVTYRNFYHPWTRWHFGGVRLAKDL